MKRKFFGIITAAVALTALFIISGYSVSQFWRLPAVRPEDFIQRMPDIKVPSGSEIKDLQRLLTRLPQLAWPVAQPRGQAQLKLFGHYDISAGSSRFTPKRDEMAYDLSSTLLAGSRRFCVIDGVFMREGETMADGAVIVKIESQQVLVAKQQRVKWIFIRASSQDIISDG